jgi:hypothetical protein
MMPLMDYCIDRYVKLRKLQGLEEDTEDEEAVRKDPNLSKARTIKRIEEMREIKI